jgi:hypothetical protein
LSIYFFFFFVGGLEGERGGRGILFYFWRVGGENKLVFFIFILLGARYKSIFLGFGVLMAFRFPTFQKPKEKYL